MELRLSIAAITDEFTPQLESALGAMAAIGMTGAELRVIWGSNIMDLPDAELERVKALLAGYGLKAVGIATPIFKCVLPNAPDPDKRFERDVFLSSHTYDDQPRLVQRAVEIAHMMGAPVLRVFSFWRTVDPEKSKERIAELLHSLAEQAAKEDLIIGLENEHTCHAGTGAETAALLKAAGHRNLKVVWDPANAYVAGENPYPDGYGCLLPDSIVHVHAKDCRMESGKPQWLPLGSGDVEWKGQLKALVEAGYRGSISLETHWEGPGGDKAQASTICGWNLRGMLTW